MPHSLRCKIKHLCHNGTITESERDRILKALEQEKILDKIRDEMEQLPIKTRINWDGCCPDIDYPEIEYVDITKNRLLSIIDKYKEEKENG